MIAIPVRDLMRVSFTWIEVLICLKFLDQHFGLQELSMVDIYFNFSKALVGRVHFVNNLGLDFMVAENLFKDFGLISLSCRICYDPAFFHEQ